MKKFVAVSLSVLMMISNVFAGAGVTVKINDEDVSFANQDPVIVDGRTLIPLRGVFEKLQYTVEWQPETKTAVLKNDQSEISVTVNADSFTVNGSECQLDVPAQIINGSMMLPLRAIGEASGLKVSWDNEAKTVKLSTEETAEPANAVVDSAVQKEMQDFCDLTHSLNALSEWDNETTKITLESMAIDGKYESGELAATKAAELTKNLIDYTDMVYNELDTTKVSNDCKTAKSLGLEAPQAAKKLLEATYNMYTGVYPNEESFTKDLEDINSGLDTLASNYSYETGKLSNQLNRVMYKYFDTEKDTEENKKAIETFLKDIPAIAEKYPIPTMEDIFNEKEDIEDYDDIIEGISDQIIKENIDDNVNKILSSVEGRKAAFETLQAPENCQQRLIIIKKTNDILLDLADILKECKNSEGNQLRLNIAKAKIAMSEYDYYVVLASDEKLDAFDIDTENEFDFEKHVDEEYSNINFGEISKETQEFANYYYSYSSLNSYLMENEYVDDMYDFLLSYDEEATESGAKSKQFFNTWLEEQQSILARLKDYAVYEPLMSLKSAIINYLDIDIQDTQLLKKIYEKQISEEQYESESENIRTKLNAAVSAVNDENSRVESKLDDYMYDYLDFDMVRTENSEADEFGKKILEINEKYPIELYDYLDVGVDGDITDNTIKKFSSKAQDVKSNISKREEEYKTVEVPKSCEKRMEILLAADKILVDFYENEKLIKNDEKYKITFMSSIYNISDCFENLEYIATNGAMLEDEETEK